MTAFIVLIVGGTILVFMWGGTLFLQSFLYNQPVQGIAWRAPAGAGILTLFLGGWCYLDTKAPGDYDTLFNFSSTKEAAYEQFTSVRRLGAEGAETEIPYKRRSVVSAVAGQERLGAKGDQKNAPALSTVRYTYLDTQGQSWNRSSANGMMVALILDEKGTKRRFNAELSPDKKTFNINPDRPEPVKYWEPGTGAFISEEQPGVVITPRPGVFYTNLFLNFLHLVLWFVVYWLLLRYTPGTSFGLAVAFWLAFMLIVQPLLFLRTRAVPPPVTTAPPPADKPAN